MTNSIRYDDSAARKLIDGKWYEELQPALLAAREEMLKDIELLGSDAIPAEKQPLDAGFQNLPQQLLDEYEAQGAESLLGRIETKAAELREQSDRFVVLGIGGSYMGMRALFEALCHPLHNELTREQRGGVPRLYFEGNNVDNDSVTALRELLETGCQDPQDVLQRWSLTVISKSGGTLETALGFRLFREALEAYYGADSEESRSLVVPITGLEGKLRNFSNHKGYPEVFPIPDNVGGRFSVFTSVGLFPAAVLGVDLKQLLQGAADMTRRFNSEPMGDNPVLDYTATCHLFEREKNISMRILSTWGKRLEALGLWYDQLLAESLGKEEKGATPLTVVNTRDLHSRGQQHQEGVRDKLITNVIVERAGTEPVAVPVVPEEENQDQLNKLEGKTVPDVLSAAIEGTNRAYADVNRPTADLILPTLDAYTVGQTLQMLMLATVLEGRLIDINPYGQPGVEAYKKNMQEVLSR
ncbi:glucose-6-phosphate isomerase [Gimesia panareensis]|uniref:Glucose-6-phosphate isomerase n=1 Tax=Gimesia panareensis TaxID=2527978 RepID=A0A518A050_9PLAN|nr:glucose-6-phosphate isomerase [Gimesia panareensis]QDT25068.1 Glucose-6-phosphate isomerase [Gimesia panareensis]QDU48061.1 Glucose-6-phosphate isomerase [Gimesia panareensis]